ncbi:hypothetical protein Ancab_034842 [Ancistrocladus abbreviatus]
MVKSFALLEDFYGFQVIQPLMSSLLSPLLVVPLLQSQLEGKSPWLLNPGTVEKSESKGCYYTSIPHVIKQKGILRQELTSLNLDKTQLLESVLTKEYEGVEDRLLGELQFAFIAFLMGQSLEAFLHWKSLVSLLFGCTEAVLHKILCPTGHLECNIAQLSGKCARREKDDEGDRQKCKLYVKTQRVEVEFLK